MSERTPSDHGHTRKCRLPRFLLDHLNARDLKILFRCWVGAWVSCLLIFITPSLTSIGTATFFACLVQLMLPPSGIVFIYLLGALSLFIGICLAWAWGVITMKAALAARPTSDTQERLASLQQVAVAQSQKSGSPPASIVQRLIFDGYMLDARVTAVTFCLLCTFIYFMARLRAISPKSTFLAIFGIIITDLFLNFTPLLPSFSGTLPLTLVKPAAIGVGLGLACSILFFPRSTSHVVLENMENIVELLKSPLRFAYLTLGKRTDMNDVKQLQKIRTNIINEYQKVEPALAFLPLDFSVGCWGAEDVATFKEPVGRAITATLSLLEFHINRTYDRIRSEDVLRKYVDEVNNEDFGEKRPHEVGRNQLSQLAEMLDGFRSPDSHALQEDAARELIDASTQAIGVCLEGLSVTKECIHQVNSRRWFRKPTKGERDQLYQDSQKALENLRQVRSSFIHDITETLIREYGPSLENNDHATRLGGLVVSMVFEEHMVHMIDATEALLTRISAVFHHSGRTRLWWPTSLKYAASWLFRRDKAPAMTQATDDDPDDTGDMTKVTQEKLRISRGYRTQRRHPVGRVILGTYHWFTSNEGLYALRMVVVTIALAIPGVIPHTAGFYYREKGLWGLIMGQTGLLVYMADFTFAVISRLVGTVVGGVLGLLAWYIGSGHGPGNPYGLSAIVAVMLVLFLWARLYLPPSFTQGGIMGGATFLLVVAYSYDDTQIPQYGNPGVGYTVFWRRLTLVLIGIAASIIVQMLPRPPSAARHISKTLSHTIRNLSDHYALLLSFWGCPRNREVGNDSLAESITIQLTESLVMLEGPIALLRFEFSSSRFDSESLDLVRYLCLAMTRNLGRLLYFSATLPLEFQERLARQTGILDHRSIGDIMAVLTVCEQALKTGDSPPEILPTPLVRRCFEYWQSQHEAMQLSLLGRPDVIRDENCRRYCVTLSSYLRFLGDVDELALVVKRVLGEAHLVSCQKDPGTLV